MQSDVESINRWTVVRAFQQVVSRKVGKAFSFNFTFLRISLIDHRKVLSKNTRTSSTVTYIHILPLSRKAKQRNPKVFMKSNQFRCTIIGIPATTNYRTSMHCLTKLVVNNLTDPLHLLWSFHLFFFNHSVCVFVSHDD